MTDYVDGELSEKMRIKILNHLTACNRCKQLEKTLQEEAVRPFKAAEKQHPPAFLWEKIKDRITEDRQTLPERIDVILARRLSNLLKTPKFAFATSAIVIMILVLILAVRFLLPGNGNLDTYVAEQAEFMMGLDSDEADFNGLDTSIEEYLLL